MALTTATDHPPDGQPATVASTGDRAALGAALRARARPIAAEVASHFPAHIRATVDGSARLATELVGRWVAAGEQGVWQDRHDLASQARQAMLVESDLAGAVSCHLTWRDLCLVALDEDATRLGIGPDIVSAARAIVQLSCDGALAATARAFDELVQVLQEGPSVKGQDGSHQVLHDDLTGLPNRLLLCDRLQQAAKTGDRRAARSMVLVLDLDNFGAMNNRFGRPAGDALLVEVAHRLDELVRSTDTVARIGDDEFAILAADLDEPGDAAQSLAERIHQAMRTPVAAGDCELHSSVSIGITEVARGVDPETLLAWADAAMRRARLGGPARYAVHDVSVGAEYRRESRLADDLRAAHGRGQLSVDYQPLFRLGAGSLGGPVGMEALLRWDHPLLGAVDPDEFVPLLEQSRHIVPVGRWVLGEAASQCVEWQRERPELTVSVNVSARQLQDPDFVGDVRAALVGSGLDPGHLVLEVTESVLVVDVVRVGAAMQAVRDLGVRMALDDFGTGYSPLLYLQGLPLDRLKVDRSFVSGLDASGHDGTVLRTVVDLAHKLGITVIAEGVETAGELRAVGAIGCDEVQGFYLGGPAPADHHDLGSGDAGHPASGHPA